MAERYDLLVRGARVCGPEDWGEVDLGIRQGRVAALGELGPAEAAETVDARGLVVLPGLIDPHMHIALPLAGTVTRNDFYTGTVAAARSGITTIVDFADQQRGQLPSAALAAREAAAAGQAVIDYLFTVTLTSGDEETLAEVPRLAKRGVRSFKLYTIYREAGLMLEDRVLLACLEAVAGSNRLATVHAESAPMVEMLTEKFLRAGCTEGRYYIRTKPDLVEEEAIHRVLAMSELVGARVYVRHLSSARGLRVLREARGRGLPVFVETGPHYLTLNQSLYERPDGHRFIVHPPLRAPSDQEALWRGIADGTVDCLGSDHCALDTSQKDTAPDFAHVPGGLPGADLLLPLLYTRGVEEGRIDLPRLAEVSSTGAARVFGLYPRKGTLRPGADADLVLLDPRLERRVDPAQLPSGLDWSPWEGWVLKGWPRLVVSRGEVIVRDDEFVGRAGRGLYLAAPEGREEGR
jgi:dihydropyrimidinase